MYWIILTAGVLVLFTERAQTSPCQLDPASTSGKCYSYVHQALNYGAATDNCQSLGGSLVKVDSPEVQADAEKVLSVKNPSDNVWIGGELGYDAWHWVQDHKLLQDQGCYKDHPFLPDFAKIVLENSTITEETCIRLCKDFQYAGLQFRNQSIQQCRCGDSFGKNGYADSASDCLRPCNPVNDPRQQSAYPVYQQSPVNATKCGKVGNQQIYTVGVTSFSLWIPGVDRATNGLCAFLSNRLVITPVWQQGNCVDDNYGYICHYGMPGRCDSAGSGKGQYGGDMSCFSVHDTKRDWFSARSDCHDRGGDLVQLDNQEIMDQLSTVIGYSNSEWWIGLARFYKKWHTGEELLYSNFASGEPSSYSGCLTWSSTAQYQWTMKDCQSEQYPSICLLDNLQSNTGVASVTIAQNSSTTIITSSANSALVPAIVTTVMLLKVILIGVMIYCCVRKRNKNRQSTTERPDVLPAPFKANKRLQNDTLPVAPQHSSNGAVSFLPRDINNPMSSEAALDFRLRSSNENEACQQGSATSPIATTNGVNNNLQNNELGADVRHNQPDGNQYEHIDRRNDYERKYTGLNADAETGETSPGLAPYVAYDYIPTYSEQEQSPKKNTYLDLIP